MQKEIATALYWREAFLKYGMHKWGCTASVICSCGFTENHLKALKEELDEAKASALKEEQDETKANDT